MVTLISGINKTPSPMLFNLWMPPYNSQQPKCIYWRNLHFLTLVWITSRLSWAFHHLKTISGMLGFGTHFIYLETIFQQHFSLPELSVIISEGFFIKMHLCVLSYFYTFLLIILFYY